MIYIIRISSSCYCHAVTCFFSPCLCFCDCRSTKERKFFVSERNISFMWTTTTEYCKIFKYVDDIKGEAHNFKSLCKARALKHTRIFFSCLSNYSTQNLRIKSWSNERLRITFKEIFLARLFQSIVNFTRKSEMFVTCSGV